MFYSLKNFSSMKPREREFIVTLNRSRANRWNFTQSVGREEEEAKKKMKNDFLIFAVFYRSSTNFTCRHSLAACQMSLIILVLFAMGFGKYFSRYLLSLLCPRPIRYHTRQEESAAQPKFVSRPTDETRAGENRISRCVRPSRRLNCFNDV